MQFYIERHRHTCGVDLHGRNLYLCVLDPDRRIVLHRRVDCDEKKLLRALAPYRKDLVIGVECMFKWYWLADFCDEHGIPFVLGHALEMRAVHGRKSEEILQALGVSQDIIRAILAHNADGLGLQRTDTLDYAITAAESITGLIVATALVMPDKRLASVKPSSVVKRMKKKEFARKVSRESILLCEQAGIPLEEFSTIAVEAMQSIAGELDL